ncbi:PEST proteolytic signal-containing nuclear protein-like isoform X2 [Mercenaria mercenaria]|uniref:PEST proteolytic signal-containing nuclear protein-like isoform X2 n=1 Tax=Mercenaria mercenaria TaxID=6596 RepID=UPI00234F11E0|nr:PEST proteolytic signal-containing nuclear protein-like isoform X2 [Mercenaria mercenaria]
MADTEKKSATGATPDKNVSPQKRKAEVPDSTDSSNNKVSKVEPEALGSGKISMSLGKKPGISMNIGGTKKLGLAPIKMALSSQQAKETIPVAAKTKKVAAVFNEESESDEEEMPMEAKMRMRNVGRETKTAAGPNSFGKGNLGFCDRTKMIERELKKQMEELGEQEDTK